MRNDPFELLKRIKVLMHQPTRKQYPYASLVDALVTFLKTTQNDGEALIDFVKRFKQARDIFKSYAGSHILDKFVENTQEYKAL